MKKLLTFLSLLLIFAGCSETPEKKVEAEPKKEVVETPKEEPKAEKPVAEIEEPVIPNMTEEKQMILDYVNAATPYIEKLTKNVQDIGKVSQIGADDPAIVSTSDYHETVQLICDDIQRNVEGMRAISVGDNEDLKSLMITLENALGDLEFVAQNFPVAVETGDMELMNQSTDALSNSSFFMGKAKERILELASDLLQ
ncbi:hypothetical protein [Fictibacillus halophilus]|uniref:hypothetical protein n=1 Tax=Fictibacillus halophilus TaxID=1610490 RepID=UPI0036D3FE99